MLGFMKSKYAKSKSISADLLKVDAPLSLTLGSSQLMLEPSSKKWLQQNSDLDEAEAEIVILTDEKDELVATLAQMQVQMHLLKDEILNSDRVKEIALDMLSEEREVRQGLDEQVKGYKEELRKSYRVIIELRKMIEPPSSSRGRFSWIGGYIKLFCTKRLIFSLIIAVLTYNPISYAYPHTKITICARKLVQA